MNTYSHSADYRYLETALQSRWAGFASLAEEIASFKPKAIAEYEEARQHELLRLQALNPSSTEEELLEIIDGQIRAQAVPDIQFYLRFRDRFMTEYVTVALLSHALCEAAINSVLAIGLAGAGLPALFNVLESASIKDKWLVGPQSFFPAYHLPKGEALCESLDYLCKQRNSLVHYKIELEVEGRKVLAGTKFKIGSFESEVQWVLRFFSLPYDLVHHVRKTIPEPSIMVLMHSGPIERASAHGDASQETPSK